MPAQKVLPVSQDKTRHTVQDWLDLHQLTPEEVFEILLLSEVFLLEQRPDNTGKSTPFPKISFDMAWDLAGEALIEYFPTQSSLISHTCLTSIKIKKEVGDVDCPRTIDRGPGSPPALELKWDGKAEDLLHMAHEMAHAVQLNARAEAFIPPLLRETAAFVGEIALLRHLVRTGSIASTAVHAEWVRQGSWYLGRDLGDLREALESEGTPYFYEHNYPPARILALALDHYCAAEDIWQVFEGRWTVRDCLSLIGSDIGSRQIENNLPSAPNTSSEFPALDAYRKLGMMIHLDLAASQEASERCIEAYYHNLFRHRKDRSWFVATTAKCKPVGYATWEWDHQARSGVRNVQKTAPFGDHDFLTHALDTHLSEIGRNGYRNGHKLKVGVLE